MAGCDATGCDGVLAGGAVSELHPERTQAKTSSRFSVTEVFGQAARMVLFVHWALVVKGFRVVFPLFLDHLFIFSGKLMLVGFIRSVLVLHPLIDHRTHGLEIT